MTHSKISVGISGLGHAHPPIAVSNQDLTRYMETSDEWISTRSGIRSRYWVRETLPQHNPCKNYELARDAAIAALKMADLSAEDLDAIVYASISPDCELPGSGQALLQSLSIDRPIPVVEVRNHCSGFLYGLEVAKTYVSSGSYRHVLLIGSEIQSTGLNVSTVGRDTAVLFGDGAGAAIISAGAAHQILDVILESDGEFAEVLGVEAPAFRRAVPISAKDFEAESPAAYPRMDGKLVFKHASVRMPEICRKILAKNELTLEDLDILVPHQANQRIIDMVSRDLGPDVQVISNIAKYGNTTAASIPIAFSEALLAGQIKPGNLICLASFGAGFAWGAGLIRW